MNSPLRWIAITALYLAALSFWGGEDSPERRRAWLELNLLDG